jgi:tetratricopeptide (TPR) repeat protein
MTSWQPPRAEAVMAPTAAGRLLRQAIAIKPDDPELQVRLGNLSRDSFDFTSAASAFEAALRLDPGLARVRPRLAQCLVSLGRPAEALTVLAGEKAPSYERGSALLALDRTEEAESEFRSVLAADPVHANACRALGKILRRSGRIAELLTLCETLHASGIGHAQLLYQWGTACALAGEEEEAASLLLDPRRVAERSLPVPAGFDDISAFNAALADELLANPFRLDEFPPEEEANRGSSRVHALFAGSRPELVRQLIEALQSLIDAYRPERLGPFDPWLDARPRAARLRAWGLLQRGSDYEDWHLHRGGWLSGVYYVRVPKSVSAERSGRGCIEFGPPSALEKALPGHVPVRRYLPREGMLLLAPSHFPHRTVPSEADEYRISFAFDVVPEG